MFEDVILFVKCKLLLITLYIEFAKFYLSQFYGLLTFKPKLPNIVISGNYDDDHIIGLLKLGYIISPKNYSIHIDRRYNHIPYNIDMTLNCFGIKNIRTLSHTSILEYICKNVRAVDKVYCYGNIPTKMKMKLTQLIKR